MFRGLFYAVTTTTKQIGHRPWGLAISASVVAAITHGPIYYVSSERATATKPFTSEYDRNATTARGAPRSKTKSQSKSLGEGVERAATATEF